MLKKGMVWCESPNTPIGKLRLFADKTSLWRIAWNPPANKTTILNTSDLSFDQRSLSKNKLSLKTAQEHPVLGLVLRQLHNYFEGKKVAWCFPVKLQGTPYQKTIWEQLKHIPYGEVISYQDLAHQTGNANAARAVGQANASNPIPIVIPCHRVVPKGQVKTHTQNVGGFAGGAWRKRILLQLEGHSLQI